MNILEQKRKLLGHCYMGGGGSSGGGGGGAAPSDGSAPPSGTSGGGGAAPSSGGVPPSGVGGGSSNTSSPGARDPAQQAQDSAAAEAARAPVGETAREAAPTPSAPSYADNYGVSPTPAAPAGDTSPASTEAAPVASEAPAAEAPTPVAPEAPANTESDSFDFDSNRIRDLRMARDAEFASYYGKDANKYALTADKDPDARVAVFDKLKGEMTKQTMMLGGGKQNPDGREVSVDVPTNSWADVMGAPPTYAEAKALQAAGLGNMTNVSANNMYGTNIPVQGVEGLFTNQPGMTPDGIVATKDFVDFVGPIAKAAAMFIPGASLAMTIKGLVDGDVTLGDITSNFALGLLAKYVGINVNAAKAIINGDFGSALSSTLINQLNPALAKELRVNRTLSSIIGKETGAYNALTKTFSRLNQNWGTTKNISNAINSGLQSLGITTGTGNKDGATGQALNLGFGADDAMDNYLGTNNGGPTLGTPAPPSTTPSITAPTKPVTKPTTPPTSTIAPGVGTTGTGASTINTQGNLFNPMGLTAPQTQQMTNAFPQLANVFYYGKDTDSKKQVLDENNQIVFEDSDQGLASGGRIADNKDDAIDAYIRHIVEQSGGPMSHRELLAIVKGI